MKKKDDIAPLPWTAQETPNGTNIHDARGVMCAMLIGSPERRSATAKLIVETINASWLKVIKGGKNGD